MSEPTMIKSSWQDGSYDLMVDGMPVGRVFKVSQSYNIAPKPITVTYWRYSLTQDDHDRTHFNTRKAALAAATKSLARRAA